jgi:hypothetical protein
MSMLRLLYFLAHLASLAIETRSPWFFVLFVATESSQARNYNEAI